jgi:L-fucose isomerase-like protein
MRENDVQAAALQCWSSIQTNYGCSACIPMSMLSEKLIPCACEMDISGAVASYALTLASGRPVGLLEWNNNYGEERDKCVLQHCSNLPRSFVGKEVELTEPSVLGASLGMEKSFGAVKGKAVAGPFTYFRVSTDDSQAKIHCYLGEGEITDDPFPMDGGIAVCRTPRLQALMKHLCKEGFEHHVSVVRSSCADVVREAVGTYLGWDLYVHE